MHQTGQFRHELKYTISHADYLALRARLRPMMRADPHAGQDGCYTIRSIYFDTPDDLALREKVDGVARREKFRIRYYNDDLSYLTLEKKMKINNLCQKFDAPICEDECRALLDDDYAWMAAHPAPLVRELEVRMTTEQLRPRVLVSYRREPYIYGPGNVRVTFDSAIRTSLFARDFLGDSVRDISATDTPDTMVLEVKYDAFLPEVIAHLLQLEEIRQTAFSKYGVCRRFG